MITPSCLHRWLFVCVTFFFIGASSVPLEAANPDPNAATWPCGIVPYSYGINMTPADRGLFEAALAQWQGAADVKFVLIPGGTTPSFQYYLVVNQQIASDASSYVGRSVLGGQPVNIYNLNDMGVSLHEIGHVLGLLHEHQRVDRGTYLTLHPEFMNLDATGTILYNSAILPLEGGLPGPGNPYDFTSVMHYDAHVIQQAQVSRVQYTIEPTHDSAGNLLTPVQQQSIAAVMGHVQTLSQYDKLAVAATYGGVGFHTRYVITILENGGTGAVVSTPDGSVFNNYGSSTVVPLCYDRRTNEIVLEARPGPDSVFAGWSGNYSSSNPIITIPNTSDAYLTAEFDALPGPPPDNPGCWIPAPTGWFWNCPTRPPTGGGRPPSQGCWHWDPTAGTAGGWIYDVCGGDPTRRDPNPPIAVTGTINVAGDPNDKQGAQGAGAAHYLSGNELLRYSVLFENIPTASAPAAAVIITDPLNTATVDLSTLKLGPISFGAHVFMPPLVELAAIGTYTTNLDLRPTENLGLGISISLDSNAGVLTWTFTSLDLSTGLPPADPLAGFLAPGEEGSVSFSVAPKAETASNTQLTNKATIVFNANASTDTPVWSNTIDSTPPASAVQTLPAFELPTGFAVAWSGTDAGAGIRDFTIFVSDSGGPFTIWLKNTAATSATFIGQSGHTYGFYSIARDLVGNAEAAKTAPEATTQVVTSALDTTPPVTTALVSPSPNANGWNNSNVTISLASVDNVGGSGVTQITYSATGGQTVASTIVPGAAASITISTEGVTTITFFGTDIAGNIETPKTLTIQLDKTRPTISGSRTPAANANGWNNTNVTASFACSDSLSGLAPGSPPSPTTLATEAAGQSFNGTCQDLAGNSATITVSGINIDKTPPTITALRMPAANANGWNNTSVTLNFTCTDSLSGLAAGSPPASTILSTEGAGQSASGACQDLAGNSASTTASGINIDMHAPTFACVPPAANNVWHITNQSFNCAAVDSLSGLNSTSPASFVLATSVAAGTETANASTNSQNLCDLAVNCAAAGPISGNMVDLKPPAISITTPINGATYKGNQTVNAAYACTDLGSGVATCTGTVPNGSKIDTSPNGTSTTKTFIVNAKDAVGNAATQLESYLVSCHYVALGVSPSTVPRGSKITVTGTVMSCTPGPQTISEKFTLTGPLGPSCAKTSTVMFTTPPFTLPAGTSQAISFPFLVPKSACAGTYTTTSTTLLGGTPIDFTSATLTVQ